VEKKLKKTHTLVYWIPLVGIAKSIMDFGDPEKYNFLNPTEILRDEGEHLGHSLYAISWIVYQGACSLSASIGAGIGITSLLEQIVK